MTALSRESAGEFLCVLCVLTAVQPTDCLPYNQCCAACKQTVQGLSFWSDRAVVEKVQSRSEHTTSSLKILAWKCGQGLLAQEVKGVTERLVTQLPHPSFTYPRSIHSCYITVWGFITEESSATTTHALNEPMDIPLWGFCSSLFSCCYFFFSAGCHPLSPPEHFTHALLIL